MTLKLGAADDVELGDVELGDVSNAEAAIAGITWIYGSVGFYLAVQCTLAELAT